jgi:hypothetical protein
MTMNTFKRKALTVVVLGALAGVTSGCNSLNPQHGVMCVAGRAAGAEVTVLVIGKEYTPGAVFTNSYCEVGVTNGLPTMLPDSKKPTKEIQQ